MARRLISSYSRKQIKEDENHDDEEDYKRQQLSSARHPTPSRKSSIDAVSCTSSDESCDSDELNLRSPRVKGEGNHYWQRILMRVRKVFSLLSFIELFILSVQKEINRICPKSSTSILEIIISLSTYLLSSIVSLLSLCVRIFNTNYDFVNSVHTIICQNQFSCIPPTVNGMKAYFFTIRHRNEVANYSNPLLPVIGTQVIRPDTLLKTCRNMIDLVCLGSSIVFLDTEATSLETRCHITDNSLRKCTTSQETHSNGKLLQQNVQNSGTFAINKGGIPSHQTLKFYFESLLQKHSTATRCYSTPHELQSRLLGQSRSQEKLCSKSRVRRDCRETRAVVLPLLVAMLLGQAVALPAVIRIGEYMILFGSHKKLSREVDNLKNCHPMFSFMKNCHSDEVWGDNSSCDPTILY